MNQPPPPLPPVRKSNYKPILLTLLFSFLLAGGSCFGFLRTMNTQGGSSSTIFGAGFLICVLVFVGAILWLAIKAIREGIKGSGGMQ